MPGDPANAEGAGSFEAVAFPHMNVLYQSARALLRHDGEAEDAVQETYLQAWRSFHRFTPGTNCRAWLFAILFNVIRHQRRKWRDRFSMGLPESFEETVAAVPSIPEQLTDGEILAALEEIPRQYSEVVLLADVQEFSYREIQQTLGIPVGTVMSRLSRGRQLLRARLGAAARQMGLRCAGQGGMTA